MKTANPLFVAAAVFAFLPVPDFALMYKVVSG
jgi:hypothetical protein